MISKFVLPVRHSDVVAPHECAFIFSNIEVILEEHHALYDKLDGLRADWPFLGNVGRIFLDIKSLFNAINVYVSNFKNAMNEVQRLNYENPKFLHFCSGVARDGEDLVTGLAIPI